MTTDDNNQDFKKPGPVRRDPLTEGWKPSGGKPDGEKDADK